MATPSDYAALSEAAYGGPDSEVAPPGWRRVTDSYKEGYGKDDGSGFFAAVYENEATREIVVANRGSRMDKHGWDEDWTGTDWKILKQKREIEAFRESDDFTAALAAKYAPGPDQPGRKITVTGHSLGGAHAQRQAAIHGWNGVTFGAPGVAAFVDPAAAKAAVGKVVNYALPGDPVPMVGVHVGTKISIMPTGFRLLIGNAAELVGGSAGGLLGWIVMTIANGLEMHRMQNYTAAMAGFSAAAGMPVAGAGRPQARISDNHVCAMVTGLVPHVGGPITKGSPNVWVGGLPAARVSDLAMCVGPTDVIILGSGTVLINGIPAARIGDMTAHGGLIATGLPTVLTGG